MLMPNGDYELCIMNYALTLYLYVNANIFVSRFDIWPDKIAAARQLVGCQPIADTKEILQLQLHIL